MIRAGEILVFQVAFVKVNGSSSLSYAAILLRGE
jgi:hypothetical protein